MDNLNICLVIILILIVFYLCYRIKNEKLSVFDTDPGGMLKYASETSAPFYKYDSKPLYGQYA